MHIRNKYPPAWPGSFVRRLHGSGPDKHIRPRADQSIRPSFGQNGRPFPVIRTGRQRYGAGSARTENPNQRQAGFGFPVHFAENAQSHSYFAQILCYSLAGVALCAKQMMRAQPDHALSPGMRLRTRKPITVARTALMTAVGMNGSTHAVTPAAIELFMSTQNIAVPTT